ncbi:hypothetical protein AB3G45_12490 [Shinella sp. S4-D37]|uniref:hypothetical protein n=1 Tax=Shinella sp. S4-D37 TaxID=3161999 RepID=UPI003465D66E
MFLVKHAFTKRIHLGSLDFDLEGLEEIGTVDLDEELQRLLCRVSDRPDRNSI